MRNAGIELLQDGNPMDLAAYAVPLANHSPYRHEGYLLAACNLTPACAPDPAAYALATLQIQHFTGFGMSFFRLRELSPRQRQIAQGQSEEIIRLWGLRRFDEMLVGRPRRHGNGG